MLYTLPATLPTGLTAEYRGFESEAMDWQPADDHSAVRVEQLDDIVREENAMALLKVMQLELSPNSFAEMLSDVNASLDPDEREDVYSLLGCLQSLGYVTLDTEYC